MKIVIYPGSFNPWHRGHEDIIEKAITIFDKIIVARGFNPEKPMLTHPDILEKLKKQVTSQYVEVKEFKGLLKDFAEKEKATAIIKGLRNGQDFEYEKTQQYWNEDLGMDIPTIYLISDRTLLHISSSAIRQINALSKI